MGNKLTSTDLKEHRPEPIKTSVKFDYFNMDSDIPATFETLLNGKYVVIEELYSNGLYLLNELHTYMTTKYPNTSFQEQRTFRMEYQKLSNLILIQINHQKLVVKKAPSIGWFDKLYPENDDFLLPFPQVQGLNSAWQWYQKGVSIPGLRNKIHPYYGVYFPTRFEHLRLFDHWLKRYKGVKKSAIDVGIGSGILSLLLMKHGFQKSYGTDLNPNAIIGLNESMKGTKFSRKIDLDYGDLFGKWEKPTELIVFNPPWLPTSDDLGHLDDAIYYKETLFTTFFEAAQKRLLPEGKIVLLFSNLEQITKVTTEHPIENELLHGNRFELDKCLKRPVQSASAKTKRNQHWRALEEVELWVLKHKTAE